mgnify:CR=1 FL=1
MNNSYKELSDKVDLLLKKQEIILKHLENSFVTPKLSSVPSTNRLSKKQKEEKLMNEMKLVILNSHRLKDQFNLAATPQSHRVLAYLKYGNPAAFDGLKRNS